MPKPDNRRFVLYEFLTTILWFCLDSSWLYGWLAAANTLSVLVVAAAILASLYAERNLRDTAIAGGILAWVAMSAFWVYGDMNHVPWAITVAKLCAPCVLLFLSTAMAVGDTGRNIVESLKKFQRVKH